MNLYQKALELRQETVEHRRWFHANAEVGLQMPRACDYVTRVLKACGLDPQPCGHGVSATLGTGEKCILLRADMDALPMEEESGEDFACTSGAAHACGHDLHAAMLLTAAKLLKEQETALNGRVKFMFQPAEEIFRGARDMIDAGILDNPRVDAALGLHVTAGRAAPGLCMYNTSGAMMASVDGFRIQVRGKGSHGAYPQNSVDPINIAVHIYLAMEALIARETNPEKTCVLTVGKFRAGTAPNIIPETAEMEGTIRTNDPKSRALLLRRLRETAELTAQVYGGTAQVSINDGVPPLICNGPQTERMLTFLRELEIPGQKAYGGTASTASEDFAAVAEKVPSTFLFLSAGFPGPEGDYPAHNPRVRFHEDVLPMGAAIYAHCALRWLEENR